jgi:serine/threonine protein phosphatase PrpC
MVGGDPARYSLNLMKYTYKALDKYDNFLEVLTDDVPFENVHPKHILELAYKYANKDANLSGTKGSSTAMICVLRKDELRFCNLGDCGIMVIRNRIYN